ncbi:hypothetical protein GXP67_01170 [Rhodocytophaga rosea]|uniref:Peptidase M41 domain-containing protein n=1 Tax=Rhodocytophaga rosea TaxID=2704465 RepID=A0A6C0GC09_9BACT|nr:hypothetical protein [Rhodocytophaga rosea]QHT65384.1 hypothetical protein GXP67_01170 [Rhodocytophaga rosea]
MELFKKIKSILLNLGKKRSTKFKMAQHEAAHGIVWFLFKKYWTVNRITIDPKGLPDKSMQGALHISPKFNVETEFTLQRANEVSSIALAGLIGQNIEIILQRDMINYEITQAKHFKDILDITGCSGDFELVNKYLSMLSQVFDTSDYNYYKFKIMDLIQLFQEYTIVQKIHQELSQLLIDKGSLSGAEVIDFFNKKDFQKHVEDNDLDTNFFHR